MVLNKFPKEMRIRFKTIIATGLGLFLALRYNDYIRSIVDKFIPSNGLVAEGLFIVLLTIIVAYIIMWIERFLE